MDNVTAVDENNQHGMHFPNADDLLENKGQYVDLHSLATANVPEQTGAQVGRVIVGAGGQVLDIDFDSCTHLGCNYIDTVKQIETGDLLWSDLFSLQVAHEVSTLNFDQIMKDNDSQDFENVKLVTRSGLYLFLKISVWSIDHQDGKFAVVLISDTRRNSYHDNVQKLVLSDSLTDYASSLMWSCKNLINQMEPAESRGFELLLFEMANIDTLTNLPNRKMFLQVFKNVLAEAIESGVTSPMGLAIIKVNDLGQINHEYGLEVGDALLATVGQKMRAQLRACDIVARISGTEFAVLLPDIREKKNLNAIGKRLLSHLKSEYLLVEDCSIKVSIGMTLFSKESETLQSLISNATKALASARKLEVSSTKVV